MDLQELTGQESGIIIFHAPGQRPHGILCNWSSYRGIPRLFGPGQLVSFVGEEIPEVEGEHSDDLSDLLDDVDITVCADYDPADGLPTVGTVYHLNDEITVIAPDGWA